ncbi:MAG: hypothetical protein H5T60_09450 [Anaerolineae bacterium]|nr:hypothetical protein [Anaerolineae bacterium]
MRGKWTITGSLIVVLLLLTLGSSLAQGPEQSRAEVQQGEVNIEANVEGKIPIQGRLTDASGNPLNGTYSITASIYTVSTGGTALCSKTQNNVNVSNGLFNMTIDNCTNEHLNGQQLYLGIKVGSDAEMRPRQPIYPVPYAFSLKPGAQISGSVTASPYAVLHAWNTATSGSAYGIKGGTSSSAGRGVYGEGQNGGTGVFGSSDTGVAIQAGGTGIIKSSAATDWMVSPLNIVAGDASGDDDLKIVHSSQFGWVALYTDGADNVTALLPADVPAYLFGTRVKFSSFHFCYSMADTHLNDSISSVSVAYVKTDGTTQSLCSVSSVPSSTSWTCQACTGTGTAIYGPVFVKFSLHFDGDGYDDRIRLGNMYVHLVEE